MVLGAGSGWLVKFGSVCDWRKLSVATKQPVSPLFKRKYHLSFNYLFRLLAVQFPCCLGPDGSSRMTRRNFHANV